MRAAAPTTSAEPRVLVDAVAAYLGVAKDSVHRRTDAKRLPVHQVGKLRKFERSGVDDWVRARGAGGVRARAKPVRRTRTRDTK